MKKLFLLIFILKVSLLGNSIILNDTIEKIDSFEIYYYKDINDNLKYQQIKKMEFTQTIPNRFTFGYLEHPVWLKLTLYNDLPKKNNYILALEEPFFDKVTLYYETNGQITQQESGVHIDIASRDLPYPNNHFNITLNPNEKREIYIKVRSYFSTFSEVFVYSEKYYHYNVKKQYFLYLLYLGAIITIGFYNLILYLYLKDKLYLYYFGYSINFGFWMGLFSGLFYLYIPIENIYYLHSCAPLALIFFILFSNNILHIKQKYPKIYLFFKYNLFFLIILFFWVPLEIYVGFQLVNVVSSYLFLSYFLLSFIEYIKGDVIAKYYLIAIGVFLISISLLSLMVIGLLPNNVLTRYLFVIGSFAEIVMFSLLLAFKINLIQKQYQSKLEDEIATQTASINKQNKQLEELVKDKETLIKELFHRVKNNFQILIAYLGNEAFQEKDKNIKKKINQMISRIKSMSIVHDMLYGESKNKTIQTKTYFTLLFENITLPNVDYTLKIDEFELHDTTVKKIGLLVNEMIVNTMKHNNSDNNIKIFCSLALEEKDYIKLEYYDIPSQDTVQNHIKKGYGTQFIQELTSSLKNCKIEKGYHQFHYIITFEI